MKNSDENLTDEYVEKATAFSHHGGAAAAFEDAAGALLTRAAEIWTNTEIGSSPLADELKRVSRVFRQRAENEWKKQRETGFIKF